MSARFEVGEVAWLVAYQQASHPVITTCTPYFGTVVTIAGAAIHSWEYVDGVGYDVITHDGRRFDVGAVCLRKRRPPQDWEKLCGLTDVPAEEPA